MSQDPGEAKQDMTRRHFVAISAWLAVGAKTLGSPLGAAAARFNREFYQVTGSRMCMGTFVNLTMFDPSKERAQAAMEKAFEEMSRVIGILNCHDDSTPVGFLNRTGNLRDLPPELHAVIHSSLRFHTATAGAFDVTIKPVLDLYRASFEKTHRPPDEALVKEAMHYVGSRNLHLATHEVSFRQDRMAITLDGIAKGYVVDRTMDVVRSAGIRHAMINAGGDIRVLGPKGNGTPWIIGVQDPLNKDKCLQSIRMISGAVATSGNYEVYFDQERLYHHIISPERGLPAVGLTSVSVMAPDAMTADALSTSAFVMGTVEGTKFLQSMREKGVRGLIIAPQQRRFSIDWPPAA